MTQEDAIRNIVGDGGIVMNGSNSGAFFLSPTIFMLHPGVPDNNYGLSIVSFNASRVVPTAAENRPVNVALLPCIVYK